MNAQKQMFGLVDVMRVEPRGGYRLALSFSDGSEGERDFSDLFAEGGEMVEPLRDAAFFARVFLDEGILTWPNGFDLEFDRAAHGNEGARPVAPDGGVTNVAGATSPPHPEAGAKRGPRRKRPRRLTHAASSRANSVKNSKRNCAPSSSGKQPVICGKMVR